MTNDGLCDVRRQNCIRTRVNGNTFIDNQQLSCKMIESKVGSLNVSDLGSVKQHPFVNITSWWLR